MENATKALMIGGAVLIAILIISMGMLIFSTGSNVINSSTSKINSVEVQAFNSEFESYEGTQKGSQLKQMISSVITSNATYDGTQEDKVITVKSDKGEGKDSNTLSTIRSGLVAGTAYNVTFEYQNGYIHTITITAASASDSKKSE